MMYSRIVCGGVGSTTSMQRMLMLGGAGGIAPLSQKFLKNGCSEIESEGNSESNY